MTRDKVTSSVPRMIDRTLRRVVAVLAAGGIGLASLPAIPSQSMADELLSIENESCKVGIDRDKGASITWISWSKYPRNVVNLADPGRLIQQSYYAGTHLNRIAEGQHQAWSPWQWNPIQGGGVDSWARVVDASCINNTLHAVTVPKLWDMPDEEAQATMHQWTSFEPSSTNTIKVECELRCERSDGDRWGGPVPQHQEIPACYFTRNFASIKVYLGSGMWRDETVSPGPPWGRTDPPLKAVALFEPGGQGIAVFSPSSTTHWNVGPHRDGLTDDPMAGPCMHVAPLDTVALAPRSTYRYRYWIVVGDSSQIAESLDKLWQSYGSDKARLTGPETTP